MINLSEPLHPVIQGEGVNIGKKMILLRVSGCNVNCPDCDSKHTWNKIDKSYSVKELEEELKIFRDKNHDLHHVLITGGNPELYQEELYQLISSMSSNYYWKFDIEAPGLIHWKKFEHFYNRIQFNFSPKIGSLYNKELKWDFPKFLPEKFIVKIVVKEETFQKDLDKIKSFLDTTKISSRKIYLMPHGTTREEIIKESQFLIPKCFELGFHFTPRLHVLIYDSKKLV